MKKQTWALFLIGFGIILGALLLAKADPIEAVKTLVTGSFGSPRAISGTLKETTPLLLAGCAVFLALRAGLFNIGVEGQLVIGACAAAAVGSRVHGLPGFLLGITVATIAGGLWALPAGLIKAYRNGHEVITTIMLNNIAVALTDYLVAGPLRDPKAESPTTVSIPDAGKLRDIISIGDLQVNQALIIGIVIAIGLGIWLKKTTAGYELRATGANPIAAQFAGIKTKRVTISAMAVSGMIAGLAGALQVFAFEGRFYQGFSPGYGFDALGVALLVGSTAWALIPSALFFGALAKGGTALTILGIPKGITSLVVGVVVLCFAAIKYQQRRKPNGD